LTVAQSGYDATVATLAAAEKSNNPTEIEAAKAAETEAKTTLAAVLAEARQLIEAIKNGDPTMVRRVNISTTQIYQPVW
jgi:guanyl-specific ribonuclease Sa